MYRLCTIFGSCHRVGIHGRIELRPSIFSTTLNNTSLSTRINKMKQEIDPKNTSRAQAFELWMKSPMPMVTLTKTFDVTRLRKVGRRRGANMPPDSSTNFKKQ